jgi:mono/diheme cytochrome c family protein
MGYTLLSAAGLAGFSTNEAWVTAAAPLDSIQSPGHGSMPGADSLVAPMSGEEALLYAAGDALFKGNCAQCHAVNEKVVGPALAGIAKRRPMSWLIPWIKNSSKMVASGDEYAVKIYNEYQKQQMPSFQLSEEEIKAIVVYVNYQEAKSNSAMVAMVVD